MRSWALWARITRERGLVPPEGDSSWQAGARLRAFLTDLASGRTGTVAAVTHGGITSDLLRDLLGDDTLPPIPLLDAGIPPCAVTAVDDLKVVMIASVAHLGDQGVTRRGVSRSAGSPPGRGRPRRGTGTPGRTRRFAAGGCQPDGEGDDASMEGHVLAAVAV